MWFYYGLYSHSLILFLTCRGIWKPPSVCSMLFIWCLSHWISLPSLLDCDTVSKYKFIVLYAFLIQIQIRDVLMVNIKKEGSLRPNCDWIESKSLVFKVLTVLHHFRFLAAVTVWAKGVLSTAAFPTRSGVSQSFSERYLYGIELYICRQYLPSVFNQSEVATLIEYVCTSWDIERVICLSSILHHIGLVIYTNMVSCKFTKS